MESFWNERYNQPGYAYGTEPNSFFASWLKRLNPGRLLLPAEGEGRNGVFAARLGWQVEAFDQSEQGKIKAMQLAQQQGVQLQYQVGRAHSLKFPDYSFDAVAFIFAHFAAKEKSILNRRFASALRPGGMLIFEAFSKEQPKFRHLGSGGPTEPAMLYSPEEVQADFQDFATEELVTGVVNLQEGIHGGLGHVVRFVGIKRG